MGAAWGVGIEGRLPRDFTLDERLDALLSLAKIGSTSFFEVIDGRVFSIDPGSDPAIEELSGEHAENVLSWAQEVGTASAPWSMLSDELFNLYLPSWSGPHVIKGTGTSLDGQWVGSLSELMRQAAFGMRVASDQDAVEVNRGLYQQADRCRECELTFSIG
ncbi:MAG: hypothetical protein EA397_17285 [Deltaproteobacteria bacterium]|nr:MAG: hypothetical protein EA397_17285 [Deltaproteobacteria bacterium]